MLFGHMSMAASLPTQTARSRCAAGRRQKQRSSVTPRTSGAWSTIATIKVPVAVVSGRPEGIGPGAFAPAIAEALPGGNLIVRPDLGHFGPLEDPEAMAAQVAGWVRAHH